MLFQVLLNFIVFFLKAILWVVFAFAAVPFGVFVLLQKMFPVFTLNLDFWFWSVFAILTIVAYVLLWKPIVWLVGVVSVLGAGN